MLMCATNDQHRPPNWIQSASWSSYLTIQGRSVVAQYSGLSKFDDRAKWIKEVCLDPHQQPQSFDLVIHTRLYSPKAERYVCFSPCGKVISASKTRADQLGTRCSFIELPIPGDSVHVSFQSSSNSSWFLGFPSEGRHIFSHTMTPCHPSCSISDRFSSCDFRFATGN